MPELPEVETVRRTLEQLVIGKTIQAVDVRWAKIIKEPDDVQLFIMNIIGQTIHSIGRRGKFLIFYLDHYAIVSHLRMEGRYGLYPNEEPTDKHTHVIFRFTDGSELRYRDVRKFGTMHLFNVGEEFSGLPLSQLGPEPFSEEFSSSYLKNVVKKADRPIKALLLDQTRVVGLGNIYVDEALFRAGIHPERKAKDLKDKEIKKLYHEIKKTLQEAIDQGGTTIRSYVNSQGQIGMFQQQLYVYGRTGENCLSCGQPIERLVVSGRGTHICPNCQS
ncbi:DNA-(apurinic or apyrimidinic site) lyase [Bacillus oleivorans]|uniref:Formamidopyrimidine-DNA glycosylase n=1 Tax=Bacillus oleivorans TaxID=1448271 RepID=A0A285CWV6_9BACI|nr:DNA-formamidopyrimidine glycosylase [Bacillus oleivorans]SNX71443.1 DNA-(apurinic or apyrimidinic site) lyase [Bacillus oleivorans]